MLSVALEGERARGALGLVLAGAVTQPRFVTPDELLTDGLCDDKLVHRLRAMITRADTLEERSVVIMEPMGDGSCYGCRLVSRAVDADGWYGVSNRLPLSDPKEGRFRQPSNR